MNEAKSDVILQRLMSLHPKIIDLTLDRMFRLLAALENPHQKLAPVVHIAGTNGKGSTLAMIRAGLESSGAKVQAYTSPHLARFHERIRMADGLIQEQKLQEILAECEAANRNLPITYFEITTVAALLAFSRDPADHCLLEVGLGGRLDATNVVDTPALTVITPVSIDHQQYLGDTIEEIAFEKAGILKPGVHGIIGPQEPRALDVIKKRALEVGATLSISGEDWEINESVEGIQFKQGKEVLNLPAPSLIGEHQVSNAGIAVAALRHLGFGDKECADALSNATWPARLEHLKNGSLVERAKSAELWLDGGHNESAGKALAEALMRLPKKPLYLICGMLNTKDVTAYLHPLSRQTTQLLGVSIPGENATLSAKETVDAANQVGIAAKTSPSVELAIDHIIEKAPNARILICGSLYLAGHVLRENNG